MKVVTVRDFRDHATETFWSADVILVRREGRPAGSFLPWDAPDRAVEVCAARCSCAFPSRSANS